MKYDLLQKVHLYLILWALYNYNKNKILQLKISGKKSFKATVKCILMSITIEKYLLEKI